MFTMFSWNFLEIYNLGNDQDKLKVMNKFPHIYLDFMSQIPLTKKKWDKLWIPSLHNTPGVWCGVVGQVTCCVGLCMTGEVKKSEKSLKGMNTDPSSYAVSLCQKERWSGGSLPPLSPSAGQGWCPVWGWRWQRQGGGQRFWQLHRACLRACSLPFSRCEPPPSLSPLPGWLAWPTGGALPGDRLSRGCLTPQWGAGELTLLTPGEARLRFHFLPVCVSI